MGGPMQPAMSKIMKASTFSWGVRPVVVQPLGKRRLPDERSPLDTWMSENTTLPHRSDSWTVSGVVKS